MKAFLSHLPAFIEILAAGTFLAMQQISVQVCSAALSVFPPGVFITTTPHLVAAFRSKLSTPVPALPITLKLGHFSMMSAVIFVADPLQLLHNPVIFVQVGLQSASLQTEWLQCCFLPKWSLQL